MLQTQPIEVPFARGMDQKMDPRWVQPGTQTSVINGTWNKAGSLRKRNGFTAISKASQSGTGAGPNLTAGVAVEAYKNQAIVSDGSHLFAYAPTKGFLFYQDQLPECIAARTPLTQTTTGIISVDCAYANGLMIYVFRANDASGTPQNYATFIDTTSGAQVSQVILTPQSSKNGLRVIANSNRFYILWNNSANQIVCSIFDATLPTITPTVAGAIITDQSATNSTWDVAPITNTTGFVVAYQDNVGVGQVHVRNFDVNAAPIATTGFAIGGGLLPVTGFAVSSTDTEVCWVAYCTTNAGTTTFTRITALNANTLGLATPDQLLFSTAGVGAQHLGVARVTSNTCLVVGGGLNQNVTWAQINTAAVTVGPTRSQAGYMLWSKPAVIGGKVYAALWRYGDASNRTFQVVDLIASDTNADSAKARPTATIAPRSSSFIGSSMDQSVSPSIAALGSAKYAFPTTVSVSTTRDGVFHTVLDFASQQRHQAVELGDSLYLAGGVPSVYDGSQVTECGFLSAPTLGSSAVLATGSVDVGDHQYAVIYKWVNARGELVRSQPAFSGTITTTPGNQTVTLQVTPYNMTTKQDSDNSWSPAVMFDLYRNTTADPATFWQVFADSSSGSASDPVSDPRTAGFVTLTDTLSDLTMTGNAFGILYSRAVGGDTLTSQCPPSLTCLTPHKNRLFAVGDDATTIWYTQQFSTGFQPAWNDQLTMICADGGATTALASMDDSLVVFKRDRIFRVAGSGPNNTGQQNDFSDFIRIPSDTGCTQSRSIIVAPQGIYFLSPQGLYLLSRSGEVGYVGKAVEDTVLANPVCLAADISPTKGEIRWCLAPSLPTDSTASNVTGVVVVYDYIDDDWSIHQYYDTDKAVASAVVMGARAPGGTWAWIGLGGQFHVESATSYLDNGHWVTLQVETAWIKANGIAGWGRFKQLTAVAEQKTPFGFEIEYAVDLSNTYQPGVTWTDTQLAARASPMVEIPFQLGIQKTQGVRFRFTDIAPTVAAVGSGQGPVLLGNSLEVGVMPGTKGKRTSPVQRA